MTIAIIFSAIRSILSIVATLVEFCTYYEIHTIELNWCLEFEFNNNINDGNTNSISPGAKLSRSRSQASQINSDNLETILNTSRLLKKRLAKTLAKCIQAVACHIQVPNIAVTAPHIMVNGVIFHTTTTISKKFIGSSSKRHDYIGNGTN